MLYPQPPVEREYRETTWKNENPFAQSVVLDGKKIVWKPGETRSVDSQYDDAIQKVHGAEILPDGTTRGGAIVGGLAPRLTKMSQAEEDRAALHESLDSDLLARREAEAAAIEAKKAADLANTNAILASAKADAAKAQPAAKTAK